MTCPCGCCARVPSGAPPPLEPGKRRAVDGGFEARCDTAAREVVATLPDAGCFTTLGWTRNKKNDCWCPRCSKKWYSAWASAGASGGQAWSSATGGRASAGSDGGECWATVSGERASASADGEQAWASASAGETSEAAFGAPASSHLLEDVCPRPPYSHGRLRVEATLAMGKYKIEDLDAVKDAFASAITAARCEGRFHFFSERIRQGQIGLCTFMMDDYKGDGVHEKWRWKTGGNVMQNYWQDIHKVPHSWQWSNTRGQVSASRRLRLPQLVHGDELGDRVAAWSDHSVADHSEAVTVVLAPQLLHAYCWVQAALYSLSNRSLDHELCAHRLETGELCQKKVRCENFCWKHRWSCAPESSSRPRAVANPPPPPPPPTAPRVILLVELWREVDCDPVKRTIKDYMTWLVTKPREERRLWWKGYLLEHHPDHHPEWRATDATDIILRETALCDFVKRARPWLLV